MPELSALRVMRKEILVTFVCEALDYIHAAMAENKILSVRFAWVKHMQ